MRYRTARKMGLWKCLWGWSSLGWGGMTNLLPTKGRPSRVPACFALCFLTLDPMWPAASCSWCCDSKCVLKLWAVSQNKTFSFEIVSVRVFYHNRKRKLIQESSAEKWSCWCDKQYYVVLRPWDCSVPRIWNSLVLWDRKEAEIKGDILVGAWKTRILWEDITPWKQNLPHSTGAMGMLSWLIRGSIIWRSFIWKKILSWRGPLLSDVFSQSTQKMAHGFRA